VLWASRTLPNGKIRVGGHSPKTGFPTESALAISDELPERIIVTALAAAL
jgi:hypothetical protein